MYKFLFFPTVVPHITDAIQDWVTRVAKIPVDGLEGPPDVCIVEVRLTQEQLDFCGGVVVSEKWLFIL